MSSTISSRSFISAVTLLLLAVLQVHSFTSPITPSLTQSLPSTTGSGDSVLQLQSSFSSSQQRQENNSPLSLPSLPLPATQATSGTSKKQDRVRQHHHKSLDDTAAAPETTNSWIHQPARRRFTSLSPNEIAYSTELTIGRVTMVASIILLVREVVTGESLQCQFLDLMQAFSSAAAVP